MIELIKDMKGRTFSTLVYASNFTIVSVEDNYVIIHIEGTGNDRNIPMKQIEQAWSWFTTRGITTNSQILNDIGCWSSSFVCGIFAKFPGVKFTTGPITLRYKKV